MSEVAQIAAGREAWQRIRASNKRTWPDWVIVGHALVIGRTGALKAAGTNLPFGKKYTRLMGEWLRATGLDEIQQQLRWRTLLCMQHLDGIERWLASLDESRRNRLSHPDAVWMNYNLHLRGQRKNATAKKIGIARHGGYLPRAPLPDQDVIRQIAQALREGWTNDTMKLAMVAWRAVHAAEAESQPPAKPARNPHEAINGQHIHG